MKYFSKYLFIAFLLLTSISSFSQEKSKTHKVEAGETVRSIAKKYQITPYDLIKINPDLQDPPAEGTVIIIPALKNDATGIMDKAKEPKKETPNTYAQKFHVVKAKETIFSLAKKYNVKIDDLFEANPPLVDGLKIGMRLHIPEPTIKDMIVEERDTTIYIKHIIKPKETRWGICHKYGITEDQLIENNPVAVQKMAIDDVLWIPKKEVEVVANDKNDNINFNYTYYEVKPKDTTYGISRKFGISIEKLREDNPIIVSEGLEIGMVLKIAKTPPPIYDTISYQKITITNLPNDSLLTNAEKIDKLDELNFPKVIDVVMMLPFYLNKNGELLGKIDQYKKTNKNKPISAKQFKDDDLDPFYSRSAIAIEFYNGAMFAIDSLKKMGLSVRLRVFDTQKNLDVVKQIMKENDFSDVDVVIGPLYTDNVEYVADQLKYDNILVVSPLSKKLDIDNRFNLVQAMPTSYTLKNSVLKEVITEKNDSTNIVVFGGSLDSLTASFINTRLSHAIDSTIVNSYIAKDNLVDREEVYKLLHPNKDNVVVIASNSNILATDVITALNQKNDSLPSRVFLISDPKILKQLEGKYLNTVSLAYPSSYFVDDNKESVKKFKHDFRKKNNYFPSMFSYRGFDITYEMLMAIGSNSNLEVGILHGPRNGIQGKFEFKSKPFGGYYNKGVFMIRYEDWQLKDVTDIKP